jgi:hypothetical protein
MDNPRPHSSSPTESPSLLTPSPEWVSSLPLQRQCELAALLTPRWNKYLQRIADLRCGLFPSLTQQAFLLTDGVEEVLFGGAAGGGKSEVLAAAALQYADVPGYAALLFRESYMDLAKPDALIPRLREILHPTDAQWNGSLREWRFPSGAVLAFGYLDGEGDAENFQGAAAQYWGFDEAGQIRPGHMEYLKTRARRRADVQVPIRFRYSANPGGRAHEWLVKHFIHGAPGNGKIFIPSKAVDNPGLDLEDYGRRLDSVDDPVLRARMRDGDWGIMDRTGLVCQEWTPEVEAQCVVSADHFEAFVHAYAGADPGGHSREQARDMFGMVWAHHNFIAGHLLVTDEFACRNPDTETIGQAALRTEACRWGPEEPAKQGRVLREMGFPAETWAPIRREGRIVRTTRVTDPDGRLVNDLKKDPWYLSWSPTAKDQAARWERELRTAIRQGRVHVHKRCTRLLKTLKYARYTDTGDYERTEETGHADLWKALVYLYRAAHQQWNANPYPPAHQLREDWYGKPPHGGGSPPPPRRFRPLR